MSNITDQHAAFYLSIITAVLEPMVDAEGIKTARGRRLYDLLGRVVNLTDMFRLEAWDKKDIDKAIIIIDIINEKIQEMYPSEVQP